MRRRVTEDLDTFGVAVGDNRDLGVSRDLVSGVDQPAIHLSGERRTGETGADVGCDSRDGDGMGIGPLAAVRQRDDRHAQTLRLSGDRYDWPRVGLA